MSSADLHPSWSVNPIACWLVEHHEERLDSAGLIEQLCARLTAAGMPLVRASYGLPTLHPEVRGAQYVWRRGGGVSEIRYPHGAERSARGRA